MTEDRAARSENSPNPTGEQSNEKSNTGGISKKKTRAARRRKQQRKKKQNQPEGKKAKCGVLMMEPYLITPENRRTGVRDM